MQMREHINNSVVPFLHLSFNSNSATSLEDKDLIIARYTVKNNAKYLGDSDFECKSDLFMILRNTEDITVDSNGDINLKINHYKVK